MILSILSRLNKYEAKRAEITNEVLANKEDLDAILNRTFDIAKEKAKVCQRNGHRALVGTCLGSRN